MSRPRDVRIMISSRAESPAFGGPQTLSAVRKGLEQSLKDLPLLGEPLFDVGNALAGSPGGPAHGGASSRRSRTCLR